MAESSTFIFSNQPQRYELNDCPWLQIIKDNVKDGLNIAIDNSQKMYQLATDLNLPPYADIASEV